MALSELQNNITQDQIEIEQNLGTPTFTWNSNSYPFIASVSSFKRELESGGFASVQIITGTVRMFNSDGSRQFTTLPQPQQKITYSGDGRLYRIESVRIDPSQSYFRLVAEQAFKGI